MIEYTFLKQIEGATLIYRNFPLPVLVCDRQFKVCWSNQNAKRKAPALTVEEGVQGLLAEHPVETLLERLSREGSVTLTGLLPLQNLTVTLLPLELGGEIIGVVAILMAPESAQLDGVGHSSQSAHVFSANIRQSVDNIFSTLDSMSLLSDLVEAGWIKNSLNRIGLDSYRILRIANNLSVYADFQSGAMQLTKTVFDLYQALRDVSEILEEMSGYMGIPISMDIPQGVCFVSGDWDLLSLAFYNALHNSLYYTKPGNRIQVSVGKSPEEVSIRLTDRGVGIPESFQPEAFRPYAVHSNNNRGAGLGLGLALVKAIAEVHGGSVRLESAAGEGTDLTVSLPLIAANTPLTFGQTDRVQLGNRFSRLYVGISDAENSPYRE